MPLSIAVSIESGFQTALRNAQLPAFPNLLQPISKRNAYTAVQWAAAQKVGAKNPKQGFFTLAILVLRLLQDMLGCTGR